MPTTTFTYRGQEDKSLLDRALLGFAATRLGGFMFVNVFPVVDRRLLRWTRGRVSVGVGQTVLLLHVRGAKSGVMRETPLLCTPQGDRLILVASKAGADHHPAWYHNVVANPDVEVDLRGRRLAMRARVLEGEERDAAWRAVNDNYPGYTKYQAQAGARRIPVVLLEPR
jgi:deazaflavin-dependent oxidoreductase (nitroreductase family)